MTSTDGQVNGNGLVAMVIVGLFIVAISLAAGTIDAIASAWGR